MNKDQKIWLAVVIIGMAVLVVSLMAKPAYGFYTAVGGYTAALASAVMYDFTRKWTTKEIAEGLWGKIRGGD